MPLNGRSARAGASVRPISFRQCQWSAVQPGGLWRWPIHGKLKGNQFRSASSKRTQLSLIDQGRNWDFAMRDAHGATLLR